MTTPGNAVRLGFLTPSSNTVLEPVCGQILGDLDHVTAHFSRFTVTEISTGEKAMKQFEHAPMLDAAVLLSHAKVDAICWNGTSASWLGFQRDVELCDRIKAETGIAAASAVLSMAEAFQLFGVKKIGLVTPYVDDIQRMIQENLLSEGFECVGERHALLSDNFSFALLQPDRIADMCRAVAAEGAEAIVILCTNLNGAGGAAALERELGIPVLDSISLAVWGSLRAVGVDASGLSGWGRLFSEFGAPAA